MSNIFQKFKYLMPKETSGDGRAETCCGGRDWEAMYRDRWSYDKVVRSTHGVNCTGSCSWNVYVKNGIVAWENQNHDYPETSPDMPDFEPRGCPRGASFSWYMYSPLRVKYPYADLPPASPQVWGDQTDVPESSDWFNAGYIITWGSNVPLTRTPDAHFLT